MLNHGLWKLGGYSPNSHFIWYFLMVSPQLNNRKRGLLIQGWHYRIWSFFSEPQMTKIKNNPDPVICFFKFWSIPHVHPGSMGHSPMIFSTCQWFLMISHDFSIIFPTFFHHVLSFYLGSSLGFAHGAVSRQLQGRYGMCWQLGSPMIREVVSSARNYGGNNPTVDGRNPAPVDRWFIPLFIGFQPSKVVQDFFHPQ